MSQFLFYFTIETHENGETIAGDAFDTYMRAVERCERQIIERPNLITSVFCIYDDRCEIRATMFQAGVEYAKAIQAIEAQIKWVSERYKPVL